MFHRKRATSNPPRVAKTPPSQAASLAATQAFLANRASNGDLSAAAAAAALRSHTTSPTPVGQLQTKRMQRRGSISSNGSAPERPGLLRRTSSGSMTERTFREPSPSRPASSHGPYARQDEAPPVPALPKIIPQSPQAMSAQQRAARRAASVEPPERVISPPPRSVGGRGASLDRGPGNYRPDERTNKAKGTILGKLGELDNPGNRNSINFSRPMSPQNSPPQSPLVGGRVSSPPPAKAKESTRLSENSIQESSPAASKVKKTKKAANAGQAEESGPAAGSKDIATQGTLPPSTPQQQPSSAHSTPSPNTVTMPSGTNELPRPKKKKKKAAAATSSNDSEGFGNAYPSDTDSVTSERSSTNERPRTYNTRAAGLLMKQPSTVREDREAEEQEDSRFSTKTNGREAQSGSVTPANTSKILSKDTQNKGSLNQPSLPRTAQRASLDIPGVGRQQSLSPARSTHFSSKPEYETPDGIKHQPPARSVSPAKSALKHSPSRGSSPIGSLSTNRKAGFAASEASDTTSNLSDDGLRSLPKKKKSVRVSFDEDSVAIGRAASPPRSPDSPVIMSPQNKPKGRSWFDLVREKKQEEAVVEADQDSVIKPMPTLPSFGSIRRDRSEQPVTASMQNQKSSGEWAQDTLRNIDTSSDNALGAILSQDAEVKAKERTAEPIVEPNRSDPLPPEVTTVEGTGYHSEDEADAINEESEMKSSAVDQGTAEGSSVPTSNLDSSSLEPSSEVLQPNEQHANVPSIALQPATPGLDIADSEQKGWLSMPGEFPDTSDNANSGQPSAHQVAEEHVSGVTTTTPRLIEQKPEAVDARYDPTTPRAGRIAEGSQSHTESQSSDESDDTGDSIYSDAAEEPDDVEGDGFGSINAIVESPAPSPIVPATGRSPPASPRVKNTAKNTTRPTTVRKESELSEPASDEGWDQAQAYWSGLSQERRRQLENAAIPGALEETVIPNRTMRGPDSVKRKKKKVPKKDISPSASTNPPMPPWPDKQYRNDLAKAAQPPTTSVKSTSRTPQATERQEPQLRSSMRNLQTGGVTQEPHLRSSMRGGPPPKQSLRASSQGELLQAPAREARGALQKKNRPTSAVAMIDYNKPQLTSTAGHIRAASAGVPPSSLTPVLAQPKKKVPANKPMLHRNDSDSSSSFKKECRRTPASGKYNMKRTMRASSADARGPTDLTSSTGGRTASPAGPITRRPFSTVGSGGGGGMRTSMRDSVDYGKPAARTSLRESMDSKRTKSPSRFGFSKSSKPNPADAKPNSRFSSRFGDSSDEEDSRPTRSSRFADSSDDEPAGLTPVRGIPRRIDEGDSTDLEDSSVENAPVSSKPKLNGVKPSLDTKPEGVALATGSLRVASGNGPSTALGTGLQAKKAAEKDKKKRSFFGNLGSKKRDDPSRVRKADIESPARRDTPLERSKTERLLATGVPKDDRILGPSSPTADPVTQAGRPALNSRTSSAANSPKSPKLQRRNTPKRLSSANDISWPLPQSPGGTLDNRPRTSDGPGAGAANGTGRPDMGARRTTVQEGPPPPTAPLIVGKTEKKKRFGMLRKAFGIQN